MVARQLSSRGVALITVGPALTFKNHRQKTPRWQVAEMPTCRNCLQEFDVATNSPTACRIHPELYSGETSQRWKEPGK